MVGLPPIDPISPIIADLTRKRDLGSAIVEEGVKAYDVWTSLAYKKPPEGVIERLIWTYGVLQQLALSTLTFPAALGAFLLEEAAQSIGMGAYLLWTAEEYELLDVYLMSYKTHLEAFETAALSLAGVNPVSGGAVIIYIQSAKLSAAAMKAAVDKKLFEQAETDERLRQKLLDEQAYGTLNIRSTPTGADIWLDGIKQDLLTPETFKRLTAGDHLILLRVEKPATGEVWAYQFTIKVTAGKKKEIMIHLPKTAPGREGTGEVEETPEEPRLPNFIKAEVRGDRAIDGDTFETTTGERIRILGMDAPETGRPWADVSTEFLKSKIVDHKIEISIQTHLPVDAYGRTLAIVWYRDENIAVSSIAAGLARAFIADDATYDPTRYLEAERIAKERRIGIWSELP